MSLPVTPPYVFGNVTSSIPLTNLDSDFATIYAAVNGIGNGTVALANVVITGGTISNVSETATSYVATKVISTSSNVGAYSYGTLSYSDVNLFESFTASANTYVQNVLQNTNSGTVASVDYVVSNNLGTATTYYGDYGMNGSGWTGTAGTNSFNTPNMVYLTSTTADLLIGTTTSNAVRFAVNGSADSAYISTAGLFTIVNDASISGLTVGKGGGSVSGNTALGASALSANTTGGNNTALGSGSLQSNTTSSNNTAVGYQAGYSITTGSNNTIIGSYTGNQGGLDIRTASNYIVLSDGSGNPRQVINNNGQALIGVTSTFGNGILQLGGASAETLSIQKGANNYFIGFYNSSAVVGSISYNGTLTIYATTSDYRLKENVQAMTGALATVSQLNPVTYDWIGSKVVGQGFIAHELQSVIPDAVIGTKDAIDEKGNPIYQQIDTSVVVATLTAAIQELNAKVTALEAKLGV